MRQKLGQHFLKNKQALDKIIDALGTSPEPVVEVGSGEGALTIPLAEKIKAAGTKLISIEKDASLAGSAKKWNLDNFEIIPGDILEVLPRLAEGELKTSSYKLIGNIPYYLTGFLLRTVAELKNKPVITVFTVQKEVAERIVAKAPKTSKLSASVQFWADAELIAVLPRHYFSPPPEVDSAIIRLTTKKTPATNPSIYYETVNALFAQPRKTILNNLASKSTLSRKEATEKITDTLNTIGINPNFRPQDLSVSEIAKIAEAVA